MVRERLLRVCQEGRELRVGCFPLGVPEIEAEMSTEIDRQLFSLVTPLTPHRR